LLPAGPGCAAILTSRYALTLPEASETLALGCLAPQAAVALLGQLCGPERVAEQPGSAAELAQLCEHLPLAVRIAGARLASRPGRPLAALVAELRDERHRLDGLRFGDLAIRSCFHVNYQALAEHPGTPERAAARLFRRFGLIRAGSVGVPVAGALLDAGNLDAELALDRLVSARLLDEAGAGYAMHDLLRLFASEQLLGEPAADREQAVHRVLCHYLSTARRAADLLRPNEVRPGAGDFAEPVPRVVLATAADALAWLDAQWPNLMAAARQVAGSPPGLARFILGLSSAAAQYMPMRGRWGDVATLAALQLRVARRLGDVPAELTALVMLASVHRQRGEYDRALHCLDRSLRGRRELGDERAVASTLVHLGQTYAASGDLDRALRCLDEAADGFRRQGRRTSEGIARFEAGEVLLQAGAYDRALACLTESLDIRVGEADLVGAGITLVGLGKAHCRIGNDAQALRLLTDGLHRCREMGAQEYVWQALLWRGDLLRRTGHPERATADLVDALAICRAAGERRGSAYALRLLGLVWRDRGQPRRAAGCRQRAAAMLAGARPPDGPVAPDDDWPAPA
jgi:tetratricopeptide (TPR) repeat protein